MKDSEMLEGLPNGTRVHVTFKGSPGFTYIKREFGMMAERSLNVYAFARYDGWGDDQTITVLE